MSIKKREVLFMGKARKETLAEKRKKLNMRELDLDVREIELNEREKELNEYEEELYEYKKELQESEKKMKRSMVITDQEILNLCNYMKKMELEEAERKMKLGCEGKHCPACSICPLKHSQGKIKNDPDLL